MPHLPSRPALLLPLTALGLALASCGDETAIDLVLVANPNVNDPVALAQELRAVRIAVGSPTGLYAEPPVLGPDFKLVDVDGDGVPDLVTERGVGGLDHLPRIRLERGGLGLGALNVMIDGGGDCKPGATCQDGKLYFAAGGVSSVRFSDGALQEFAVDFNRRALYLPPRVTQVYPRDGAQMLQTFGEVSVIFSKDMITDSLTEKGVVRLLQIEGGSEVPIPGVVEVTHLGGIEDPAVARIKLPGPLGQGSYKVRVATDAPGSGTSGARDISGRYLDQLPMQAGDQPFASSFSVAGEITQQAACQPACHEWCSEGGTICLPGLTCDKATRTCLPEGCPETCPSSMVCDPGLGRCVVDCRLYGSYGGCAAGKKCQAGSGVCS